MTIASRFRLLRCVVAVLIMALGCVRLLPAQATAKNSEPARVRYDRLRPELQFALGKLGDRLSVPNKETLVLQGTVSRASGAGVPFRLLIEAPNRIRFEEGPAGQAISSGFDGEKQWKSGGQLAKSDAEVLESALLDSMDRFLFLQAQGRPTRKIGSRFRLNTGTTTGAVPVYDIYGVLDEVKGNGPARPVWKWYYVNSNTLLLDVVEYRTADGSTVRTVTDSWQQVGDQWVPKTVVRMEGGRTVLRFDVASAAVLPKQPQSTFEQNGRP